MTGSESAPPSIVATGGGVFCSQRSGQLDMYDLLKDVCVVEGASFIAAPSCGLYLGQLGAEVIRFDMIGGGPDFHRWPKTAGGASLYWEGLNKGKKSIAINLASPAGRELAVELASAAGLFVTNFPADGFLAHENLRARRADMISVRVTGWSDGTNAMDYTVNAALGIPSMTGPPELGDRPVNHVLPAWDLLAGAYAAFMLLAAERRRCADGEGAEVLVPLGDIGIATLGNLGQLAEVFTSGADRPRFGNDLFGAFGRDFATRDGGRVMVAAITKSQWRGLVAALDIGREVAALEGELGVSFAADEGLRFRHRDRLNAVVGDAIAARDLGALADTFRSYAVTWAPYRTVHEALTEDPRLSTDNPLLSMVTHPGGGRYPTNGAPGTLAGEPRNIPVHAPRLGEHTDEILATLLGLSSAQIGRLLKDGVVARAND